jgi:benzoate 4-monooxygenase
VRISPSHISIADPKALQQIYGHKTGFLKGPFYEDMLPLFVYRIHGVKTNIRLALPFHQVEPVLFNTRDRKIHQRKKKIMSPAFSARGLQDFEPHMSRDIRKLIDLINERVQASGGMARLDFNEYCSLQLPVY